MKIGLTNRLLPDVAPQAFLKQAKAAGYGGVVVSGDHGQLDTGPWAAMIDQPDTARGLFHELGIALVGLRYYVDFASHARRDPAGVAKLIAKNAARAAAVDAEYLVLRDSSSPRESPARAVKGAMATFECVARHVAGPRTCKLAIESAGRLAATRELWTVSESAGEALCTAYDAVESRVAGDSISVGAKRLARSMGLVFVHGAQSATTSDGRRFTRLDGGASDVSRLIEILKGIRFDGWVCVDWPESARTDLEPIDDALAGARQLIQSQWDLPIVQLSAYKGDKNAPRFAASAAAGAEAP